MSRDGLQDVVDWTDARGGPPRINAGQCLVLRDNKTRQAAKRYCMDLPFVCGFIHAAENWFMSYPTRLHGGYIVLQVGRGRHGAIVLVDTAGGQRQHLDAGQAPIVVRDASGTSIE